LNDEKTEQLKLELEKKDAEIEQLKNVITQWQVCSWYILYTIWRYYYTF